MIASGGVGDLSHLEALAATRRPNIEGAIVGRALYEHSFTVAEAHRSPCCVGRGPARTASESSATSTLVPMVLKRVIPCLDVDAGRVVKGTNFVGLRDAGDPVELAERYDAEGADELVFLDITASHEKRETIVELARRTADNVFIPFTIGGGIRSVEDAQAVLDAGADKVSVNSAALARPELLGELADAVRRPVRGDRDRRQARGGRLGRLRQRRPQAVEGRTRSPGPKRRSSSAPARCC